MISRSAPRYSRYIGCVMLFRTLAIALLFTAWLAVRPVGAQEQKDDFPAGRGRDILEASCTSCHDMEEVANLRGKLTADGWRGIVKTMTDYGAQVDPKDVGVLVEYLNTNFGKKP